MLQDHNNDQTRYYEQIIHGACYPLTNFSPFFSARLRSITNDEIHIVRRPRSDSPKIRIRAIVRPRSRQRATFAYINQNPLLLHPNRHNDTPPTGNPHTQTQQPRIELTFNTLEPLFCGTAKDKYKSGYVHFTNNKGVGG